MKLDLKRPCKECPFKNDLPYQRGWLGKSRAKSIVDDLYEKDKSFACHKTIDLEHKEQQHCAGAMIMMERQGLANQYMRIMERIGMYDRDKLDMNTPVFDNPEQFISWHSGSEVVTEYQERQRRSEQLAQKDEVEPVLDRAEHFKKWLEDKDKEVLAFLEDLESKGLERNKFNVSEDEHKRHLHGEWK